MTARCSAAIRHSPISAPTRPWTAKSSPAQDPTPQRVAAPQVAGQFRLGHPQHPRQGRGPGLSLRRRGDGGRRLGVSRGHDAARQRRHAAARRGRRRRHRQRTLLDQYPDAGRSRRRPYRRDAAQDGRILGGDAFFYYLGAYCSANGRWKGEFVNQEHAPAKAEHPLFGGYEVGIGFSGRCDAGGAEIEATALAGKRSIRLAATLKLIQPFADGVAERYAPAG